LVTRSKNTIRRNANFTPIPNIEVLARDLKRLRDESSIFEDFNVIGRWGTPTDFVTNFAPVISPINRIPGLTTKPNMFGERRRGAATGEMVADMIDGVKPEAIPEPSAFSRFKS